MKSNTIIGLIGNPNTGKTTLFNQLTGARQQVGNWPGVTVERKSGFYTHQKKTIEVVDLPGVYTLNHFSQSAIDESIARNYIATGELDILINVLDASHLERHLYLTAQLIEMQVPMILAVNMMDVIEKQGHVLDIKVLSAKLGCPIIPLSSHKGEGITALKDQIERSIKKLNKVTGQKGPKYSQEIEDYIKDKTHSRYESIRQLEENAITGHWQEDPDIIIASARYTWAHELAKSVLDTSNKMTHHNWTVQLDRWILNRFLGIPLFLSAMYLMFLFSVHVSGIFQDFFDQASDAIFVQGTAHLLQNLSAPAWCIALLSAGAGKGINTTLTFIPILAGMFFCLSFLEASGYMARAAFVMDRLMRALGLPGKSLVPMIMGFGCNVPAIMSARTLDNPRDRVLTVMMTPFMSCSARLAIFSVFVTAFFPIGGQNIIFILYLVGIVMALLTGCALRKTLLQGKPSPWIMELPSYHWPTWKALLIPTMLRTQHFIWRAGKVILPVCILIGVLNGLTLDGHFSPGDANENSLLSLLGKTLTPIFAPIGLTQDNWPATVGLITGTLAKEVVIATLNTLYVQAGHLAMPIANTINTISSVELFNLGSLLKDALMTIPEHLQALPEAIRHPLAASMPTSELSSGVYGEMYTRFAGSASAFAYLLFVLLYIPCASTMAVIRKELNTPWMTFSILWSTALAYSIAVLYYQSATFLNHPWTSGIWFFSIVVFYSIVLTTMNRQGIKNAA